MPIPAIAYTSPGATLYLRGQEIPNCWKLVNFCDFPWVQILSRCDGHGRTVSGVSFIILFCGMLNAYFNVGHTPYGPTKAHDSGEYGTWEDDEG